MSKIVNYDGFNSHTVSAGKDALVRLVPGANTIDDAVFDKLMDKKKGSEGFRYLIEEGSISILDDDAVGDSGVVISKAKVGEAKSIIDAEIDLEVLAGYLEEETTSNKPRDSIIEHIEAQIEKLNSDTTDE